MTSSSTTTAPFAQLARPLAGHLITPDTGTYDELRQVFVGGVDPKPAAIARVAHAEDVARTVTFAREHDIPLAVRCGGHSDFGQRTADEGLVLDLRDLRSIDLDTDAQTVWAGAGWDAVELNRATGEQGLIVGFGDTGSVGISGITLGGGIGYLTRKYGMTIDALLAAEIVTADGELLHVDKDTNPDLFWAIRGGGGNFGVVTRFKYRLHPVGQVYGGMLVLPATPETVDGFMRAAADAPEELSTIANVMPAPPMPFLPEELHGKMIIFALLVAVGDLDAGERAMGPFRALATPLADMLAPMPYPDIYGPEDPDYRPTPVQRGFFIDHVDLPMAQAMIDALEASDASLRAVQLRALGGAMARVPDDATAFGHRTAPILAVVVAFHDTTDEDKAKRRDWVEELVDRMRQGPDQAYVNFLTMDDPERIRAAYPPETWDRLVSIKSRYDPTNLFRGNMNIPPA
jgi:FAD/FMN-containing dehydrogenase